MVDILKLRKMSASSKPDNDGDVDAKIEKKTDIGITRNVDGAEKQQAQETQENHPTITMKEVQVKPEIKAPIPKPEVEQAPVPDTPPIVTSQAGYADYEVLFDKRNGI